MELECLRCSLSVEPVLKWRVGSVGVVTHLGAYCPACDAWLKWVPQTPDTLDHAPPKPNLEKQEL